MMDPVRRNILATGAAATAMAAAPQVFAQQADQGGPFKFYEKGNVRIRYQEAGSGFPLLVTPGGGLNSRISNWQTAVINAMAEFKSDFRCITMDQRNATGGEFDGADPGRRPLGRLRRRPIGADGPPRHPPVPVLRQLHRRLVCPQADGARPGPHRRGGAEPTDRAPAGEPRRDVQDQSRRLGQGVSREAAGRLDGDDPEVSAQPLRGPARLRLQRVAGVRAQLPDADAGPAGRHPRARLPDRDRRRFAGAECRHLGLSLEGPAGTEGADDQPGAQLPEGAPASTAAR